MSKKQKSCVGWLAVAALAIPQPGLAEGPVVAFRGSFSWITGAVQREILVSTINPGNSILTLPETELISEPRPNLKLAIGDLTLVARPRIRLSASRTEVDSVMGDAHGKVQDTLNEAFLQWTVSDALSFTYGLSNFQWGAAEALSPSNRLFHETAQSRHVLSEDPGRHMARINLTAGKAFSAVIMLETKENRDVAPFSAEEAFAEAGLFKPEISWNNGADYLGLVFGTRAHERAWVGEYFNVSVPFWDGLALYGDAAHQKGSRAWYPNVTSRTVNTPRGPLTEGVVEFQRTKTDSDKLYTLAVLGLKYDFVGGSIVRFERIRSDAAYTADEEALVKEAFVSPTGAQAFLVGENLPRYLRPGLDVPSQDLVYTSLHTPEPLEVRDLTFFGRVAMSLRDRSLQGYFSLAYKVGEGGTITAATALSGGDDFDELRGYASPTYYLTFREDW